jgi:hypothetical protein
MTLYIDREYSVVSYITFFLSTPRKYIIVTVEIHFIVITL